MKKIYETPTLSEIKFQLEERLMASVVPSDGNDKEILPPVDIFGK